MTNTTRSFCRLLQVVAVLLGSALGSALPTVSGAEVSVGAWGDGPAIQFGLKRLARALEGSGDRLVRAQLRRAEPADILLLTSLGAAQDAGVNLFASGTLGQEGFRLARLPWRGRSALIIAAEHERGAMYGLLEAAEQLQLTGALDRIPDKIVKPRFDFRAIKFNLPWMSYRQGEALQTHVETCRDLKFWEAFLNTMAENRFNVLSLWNLHPFTFLIRPKNFPEACPFNDAELADWQHFWRTLFRMAKDRGIDTYLINWNIFVSPEFAKAHNVARYSIHGQFFGEGDTSALVERYTRECVTQVINEYDDLAGLGITLGEGMGGMTPEARRDWLERTFLAGMKAAQRPVRFVHRAPLSANKGSGGSVSKRVETLTRAALEKMDLPAPIWVPFKYNWSHGHSSPRLHLVHGGPLTDTYWNPPPKNYQVVWTVRNEDFFVLRWGQPDFIREFIRNNGQDYVGGCFIGSECYIPARDYIHLDGPHRTWDYAFQRQWLFYQMWGRLLFDPATPDAVFVQELERRYGPGLGQPLFQAWRLASRTPLRIASFFRGTWDGTLYTEGFLTHKRGHAGQFIDIDTLINRPVLDPRYVSIADFVKAGGTVPEGKTSPLALADQMEADCSQARILAEEIRRQKLTPTLACELADIESWAWLGRYFADKLRGGVALATYYATGEPAQKKRATDALFQAFCHWRKLADAIHAHNQPTIPYVFDEDFSWSKHLVDAQKDVETARNAKPRTKSN